MQSSAREYWVGVDVGGTKILAGVFDSTMLPLGCAKLATRPLRDTKELAERVSHCILNCLEQCQLKPEQIKAIGVGAPGTVDVKTGTVLYAVNLGWQNIPLKRELERRLGIAVFVDNDCNLSLLGIYEFELERKPKNVAGLFVGTGIGGALIVNGQPYAGFNHAAGEFGHMVIDYHGPKCGCGNRGCLEVLASRTAILKRIQREVKAGEHTELIEIVGEDFSEARSRRLRRAIKRGDPVVLSVVQEAADYLGIAVGNIINAFNPEVVVLGGGIIEALDYVMMPVIELRARKFLLPGSFKGIDIMSSKLGDNAGIMGGAFHARQCLA